MQITTNSIQIKLLKKEYFQIDLKNVAITNTLR